MLSTNKKLKCPASIAKKMAQFQYPVGSIPGSLSPLRNATLSYLPQGSWLRAIFLELLPNIAGVIVLLFFIASSYFILYGVLRHLYMDNMVVKRKKILKKLGKLPKDSRKRYRRSTNPKRMSRRGETEDEANKNAGNGIEEVQNKSKKKDKPYYLSDTSASENEAKHVLSDTQPPISVDKNGPPLSSKPLVIPGSPFPELPNVPEAPKGVLASITNKYRKTLKAVRIMQSSTQLPTDTDTGTDDDKGMKSKKDATQLDDVGDKDKVQKKRRKSR